MSVIAYKDGVMAGDTRAFAGRYKASPGPKRKIHRLKDGSLLGVSSSQVGMADKFAAWVRTGGDENAWKGRYPESLEALLVKPNGEIFLAEDDLNWTGPIRATVWAIGSGSEFALGAMAAGKTAVEAVRIACALCPYCALPVMTLKKA